MGQDIEGYRIIDGRLHQMSGSCQPTMCNAWCCNGMLFHAPKINPDDADYYRAHGCGVTERGNDLLIFVLRQCNNLNDSTKRCKIYGNRPSVCRKYAMRRDSVYHSDHCTLEWKPVTGRKAQIIMKRMRDQ